MKLRVHSFGGYSTAIRALDVAQRMQPAPPGTADHIMHTIMNFDRTLFLQNIQIMNRKMNDLVMTIFILGQFWPKVRYENGIKN